MGRKIVKLQLHQGVFAPGLGDLGSFLPPNNKVIPDLAMTAEDTGVFILAKGFEVFVPWPNVVSAVLAPEEKSKK